ncbi:hypothetical protein DPMN_080318 [Dreissena polymorpha]|uniref:Uncharacterized protein n=1 Tax=Dreissena polymorpha TaxID=45954 RepID=A0A9D3YU94_DREPO|nr:hypothetical protein DPMN_080318 [Dreissena polymorpha]
MITVVCYQFWYGGEESSRPLQMVPGLYKLYQVVIYVGEPLGSGNCTDRAITLSWLDAPNYENLHYETKVLNLKSIMSICILLKGVTGV